MSKLPWIAILFLTYERTEYAVRSARQTRVNLLYPNLTWYIADAGSPGAHTEAVLEELNDAAKVGYHSESLTPGQSWNRGILKIFENLDIYIRLEDDWVPSISIDITPFVKMLMFREDIGMVRLGYQHVPADMEAIGIDGVHYYRYSKSSPFCYGGHPAIIHKRFHAAYGYNNEEMNPGQIEIDMDERVRSMDGPDIVRPAEIGGWGAFAHIGEVKGY